MFLFPLYKLPLWIRRFPLMKQNQPIPALMSRVYFYMRGWFFFFPSSSHCSVRLRWWRFSDQFRWYSGMIGERGLCWQAACSSDDKVAELSWHLPLRLLSCCLVILFFYTKSCEFIKQFTGAGQWGDLYLHAHDYVYLVPMQTYLWSSHLDH